MLAYFRPPHEFIRRRMRQVQRLLSSGALAALAGTWMHRNPVYPPYWEAAIAFLTILLGTWSPLAAWWVAGLAILYGVYHLSFYLAVLGLSLLILGQRPAARHLGGAALVLAAPFLLRWHLGWVVPLLGGVYLGISGGAWSGALAALWSEIFAALHGYAPDFLLFPSHSWSIPVVTARFAGLNSWRTLAALGMPLAPDPTALLYHLLQIAAWGVAGALAGRLWQAHPKGGRPSGVLLAAAGGAASLALLQGALSLWLGQHSRGWLFSHRMRLLLPLLLAPLTVAWIEGLRAFFSRPLPFPTRKPPRPSAPNRKPSPPARQAESPPEAPGGEIGDDDNDLIMLELD